MPGCLIALLICAGLAIPVLAILAAIALPAYQDYTVRAKVTQAIVLAEPLKAVVVTHLGSDGSCPGQSSNALAAIRQQIEQSPYVAAVRAGTLQGGNCAFEITLRGIGTQADGKTLLFEAQRNGEQVAWDCRGGDLPARHRPTPCRTMD
jgi:type IV pilus assembly protein PilA